MLVSFALIASRVTDLELRVALMSSWETTLCSAFYIGRGLIVNEMDWLPSRVSLGSASMRAVPSAGVKSHRLFGFIILFIPRKDRREARLRGLRVSIRPPE